MNPQPTKIHWQTAVAGLRQLAQQFDFPGSLITGRSLDAGSRFEGSVGTFYPYPFSVDLGIFGQLSVDEFRREAISAIQARAEEFSTRNNANHSLRLMAMAAALENFEFPVDTKNPVYHSR